MGNKGSKAGGGGSGGSKSMRPPVKSDNRGFKFGNTNNAGRDAGKSAPAAPSTAYGAAPPAPSQGHGGAPPPPPSDDNDCTSLATACGCRSVVITLVAWH